MERVMCASLVNGADCLFTINEHGQWVNPFVVRLLPGEDNRLLLHFAPLMAFTADRTMAPAHPATYICLYQVEDMMAEKYHAHIQKWTDETKTVRSKWEADREFEKIMKEAGGDGKVLVTASKKDC